ncbi:helix-turn-helix transcriptional regulator [Thalassospira australica]|uniref:helix-turn-helix transcriptional regulator n=1 Tax=Thalassospira australica TaxID=1528106 RepID=UPI00051A45E2|nr:helix-turn-helix transcriptional regulator [Thalassospira australica]
MGQMDDQTQDAFGFVSENETAIDVGELRLADGELFELPGVRGRLERIDFGNGTCLYRAELNVREDSRFDVQNSLPAGWLAGSVNLIGSLDLKCPSGRDHSMSSEIGLMMRIDPVGTRYLLPGGQLIRHAGVSIELDALKARFGDVLPDVLDRFLSDDPETIEIRPLRVNNKIRSIVSAMFSAQVIGQGRQFKLEGLSTLFLAEVIDAYIQQHSQDENTPEPSVLEQTIVQDAIATITQRLASPLSVAQLADDADVTESRFNSLFKRETDKICAEFIRSERMVRAREMLAIGEMTVKQVAAAVGFNHVSNFSRSYRDWFGESPAQALNRKSN